jgi:hypothetical protein
VIASRDDVFEDISQADARNGNPERGGFRTTQGVARLTLAPTARLTLESSALYRQCRAEIDVTGLLPTGQIGFVDDLGAFAREETWVAQTARTGPSCRAGSRGFSSASPATTRACGPSTGPSASTIKIMPRYPVS